MPNLHARIARHGCGWPRREGSRVGQGIACDASGCIGRLVDGARVAYALMPDAFEDDCREADLVVAAVRRRRRAARQW
jgi:hypothetical protein